MNKTKLTGAMLATAVALIFAGNTVYAADSTDSKRGVGVGQVRRRQCVQGPESVSEREQWMQGTERVQGQGLRDDAVGEGMRRGGRQTGHGSEGGLRQQC